MFDLRNVKRKGQGTSDTRIPYLLILIFILLSFVTLYGVWQKAASLPEYVGRELDEDEEELVIERNSPLISYVMLSPNADFPRKSKIRKITIHHMAGDLSLEALGESFMKRDRNASANYAIDVNGNVALYVEEANRAWTSSDAENDNMAVTIEVANEELGGDWKVSGSSFDMLIELCTDICRRNGIESLVYTGDPSGNLTIHKMFDADTECPGPYLESRMGEIAELVNERIAVK